MNIGRMVGSLLGAMGGGTVGRMLGGSTGGMIGSLAGSMLAGRGLSKMGGLGGLLGGLTGNNDDQAVAAADMAEDEAMVLLTAMCNAAKSDGTVDEKEVQAIIERAGDLDDEEQALLREKLAEPLDTAAFVASVPNGMESQVYAASLLAIEVDTVAETQYLKDLAAGLGISRDNVQEIHESLGV